MIRKIETITRRVNFDMDALRSFRAGVELGSFTRAAEVLGRSASALSAQLRKLEDQAGAPLLRKQGRQLALTDAGETMLSYARRLLDLNDEAALALDGARVEGTVRLGLQEDFGERLLSEVLARFARSHPGTKMEVRVTRSVELMDQLQKGRLDLAMLWDLGARLPHVQQLGQYQLHWIGAAHFTPTQPVPLVVMDGVCAIRALATDLLDRAGIPWRIVFTSPSLGGVWAAVAAGLGVTVRTGYGLPSGLRTMQPEGWPEPPVIGLRIARAAADLPAPCLRLEAALREAVRAQNTQSFSGGISSQ